VSGFQDVWNWYDSWILTGSCEQSRFLKNQKCLSCNCGITIP
jgi:hypothetical protein